MFEKSMGLEYWADLKEPSFGLIAELFFNKIKTLQYIILHYTVPSIAKKDMKSPSLHYG